MHKYFVLWVIAGSLLTSCGGEDIVRAKEPPRGPASVVDYDRLIKVNEMQQDMIDARLAVHHGISPLLSKKAEAISGKITPAQCKKVNDIPDDDFSGGLKKETITNVNADSCPIYWYREREWNATNKVMFMMDKLEVTGAEFRRDLAGFATRNLSGSYKVVLSERGYRVVGNILLSNFQTLEFGAVGGTITIDSSRQGDEGRGEF